MTHITQTNFFSFPLAHTTQNIPSQKALDHIIENYFEQADEADEGLAKRGEGKGLAFVCGMCYNAKMEGSRWDR